MKMTYPPHKKILLLLALVGLFLPSCLNREEYSAEDIEALINEEVAKRIDDFKRIKLERCEETALKEANRIVDSLLIEQAFFERDTFFRPDKPNKPERPVIKQLGDSLPLKPLFQRKDTLQ